MRRAACGDRWLGRNSTHGKMTRLLREVHLHSSLHTSADRTQFRDSYLPVLLDAVTRPLQRAGMDGVKDAVDLLVAYDLTREDVDSMIELAGGLGRAADPLAQVPSNVKAAFTRTYNSGHHPLPYSLVRVAVTRGGGGGGGALEAGVDPDAEEEPEVVNDEAADEDEDASKDDEVRRGIASSDQSGLAC